MGPGVVIAGCTEALRGHNNKTKTAMTLGITREGLHKKLAKFGV